MLITSSCYHALPAGPSRALREVLDTVGLVPFVMTTGSRGLHVVAPLDRSADFETARAFARDLADLLAQRQPGRLTTAMRKSKRGGRLFLNYLRNSYEQNSVAPETVRAKPGAPIATPLNWDELDDGDLRSQTYAIDNIFRRLGQKADPWRGMLRHARSLERPRERLDEMRSSR
jgi:bifunctional non-homologous end joining protein LigD